jgi:hypothetical protein
MMPPAVRYKVPTARVVIPPPREDSEYCAHRNLGKPWSISVLYPQCRSCTLHILQSEWHIKLHTHAETCSRYLHCTVGCDRNTCSRTALIRTNWDSQPSRYAENLDNWIFHCFTLRFITLYIQTSALVGPLYKLEFSKFFWPTNSLFINHIKW